jgi:hypothetical protein
MITHLKDNNKLAVLPFIGGNGDADYKALTRLADNLFVGNIRRNQRGTNRPSGQGANCQEVVFCAFLVARRLMRNPQGDSKTT